MEILSISQKENLFNTINDFLCLLYQKDEMALKKQFDLDKARYDEIIEDLMSDDILLKKLTLAPRDIIFELPNENRAIFDIWCFETKVSNQYEYGIEACIYADNQETDYTLVGAFTFENEDIKFGLHFFRL